MFARVLVAEDDSTVSEVLSAYLRKAGFDPRVAADGAGALQEWTPWKPDVVIVDVMLPWISGLETRDAGAGLGHAIASGVMESHARSISVANVEGGCRFDVALPTHP